MKVLHLVWRFEKAGGIESFCLNLLRHIQGENIHCDFAVCGDELPSEKAVTDFGCKIYHLPIISGPKGKKEYLKALEQVLQNNSYDVIHSHLAFMNISTLRLAKKYGIRNRISHCHVAGHHANPIILKIKRVLMNYYATSCLACSSDTANFYYGAKSNKKIGLWVKMGVRIVVSILIIRVLYHFKAFQHPFYRSTCSL